MTRKKGRRDMHKSDTYGFRTKPCPRCKIVLNPRDFTDNGICLWCAYDLSRPTRLLQVKVSPITRPPAAPR